MYFTPGQQATTEFKQHDTCTPLLYIVCYSIPVDLYNIAKLSVTCHLVQEVKGFPIYFRFDNVCHESRHLAHYPYVMDPIYQHWLLFSSLLMNRPIRLLFNQGWLAVLIVPQARINAGVDKGLLKPKYTVVVVNIENKNISINGFCLCRVLWILKALWIVLCETSNTLRNLPKQDFFSGSPPPPQEFYHRLVYKALSSDCSFADPQSAFQSDSKEVWGCFLSETAALFRIFMKIHSNLPILYYGFKVWFFGT